MSKTLFKNLRIINPAGTPVYIANGCISSNDGIIDHVGGTPSNQSDYDEVLDMKGKTAVPGMIDAHTHLYSALSLGMPSPRKIPRSFIEKLRNVWWKLDLALDEASTYASYQAGILACLRSGVTTIMDHHSSQNFISGSTSRLVEVANRFGVRITTAFEVTDRNGPQRFEAGLHENLVAMRDFSIHPYVHPMMGLHASFTLSDTSLKIIAGHLDKFDNPGIHIHVGEDKADQQDAIDRGFESVIDRLTKMDVLNKNSLIIHGIYLSEADYAAIKQARAFLVHCPTSNANNRVGLMPGEVMKKMTVGLGTDGMQANMLREAKEGALIRSSHISGRDRNIGYLDLLFKQNAAIASRLFNQKIGLIEKGYHADFVLYDYQSRTKFTEYNVADQMLNGMQRPCDVVTRGKFRIRSNKFVNINEDEILANARLQSVKLWEKVQQIG